MNIAKLFYGENFTDLSFTSLSKTQWPYYDSYIEFRPVFPIWQSRTVDTCLDFEDCTFSVVRYHDNEQTYVLINRTLYKIENVEAVFSSEVFQALDVFCVAIFPENLLSVSLKPFTFEMISLTAGDL
jgi:hypothetical protein